MKLTVKEFKEIVDLLKDDVEVLLSGNGSIQVSDTVKELIDEQSKINNEHIKIENNNEPNVINLDGEIDLSKCDETTIQNRLFRRYCMDLATDLNRFMCTTCITEEYVPRSVRNFYQELVDSLALFEETRLVDFGSICDKFNNMQKDITLPLFIHKDYCRLANLIIEVDEYYEKLKEKVRKQD